MSASLYDLLAAARALDATDDDRERLRDAIIATIGEGRWVEVKREPGQVVIEVGDIGSSRLPTVARFLDGMPAQMANYTLDRMMHMLRR